MMFSDSFSHQITSKLAKRLLEKEGYSVDCVMSGTDCIAAVENRVYSVLLINAQNTSSKASTRLPTSLTCSKQIFFSFSDGSREKARK